MAKEVFVKLTEDSEWIKTEVANFYDPERHHNIRLPGKAIKESYAEIKMPDGRIYSKITNKWRQEAEPTPEVIYKLHLGCGKNHLNGFVNIDKSEEVDPDLVLDLEEGKLPFANNSVEEIKVDQVLEHIHNLIPLLNECHRVLTRNGVIQIAVPNAVFIQAFQDPTHVRFFTDQTFNYWYEGHPYYEQYGKSYGITGFRKLVQKTEGMHIKASLWK